MLPIVVVNSVMDPKRKSWTFTPKPLEDRPEVGIPGTVPEPLHGAPDLRALYEKSEGPMDGPYVVRPIYLFAFLDRRGKLKSERPSSGSHAVGLQDIKSRQQ